MSWVPLFHITYAVSSFIQAEGKSTSYYWILTRNKSLLLINFCVCDFNFLLKYHVRIYRKIYNSMNFHKLNTPLKLPFRSRNKTLSAIPQRFSSCSLLHPTSPCKRNHYPDLGQHSKLLSFLFPLHPIFCQWDYFSWKNLVFILNN